MSDFHNSLRFINLTVLMDLITFHTNIITSCQQNRYVRLAIYIDLFTLPLVARMLLLNNNLFCVPEQLT